MHKLAPLKLASPSFARRSVRLPGRLLQGFDAIQIKVPASRAGNLIGAFGLPEALETADIDHVEALWMGPGEWLAMAPPEHFEKLDMFESLLTKSGVAAIRCGSRLSILELEITAQVMCGLTGLLPPSIVRGRVARTRLADVPVTIVPTHEGNIRVLFDRVYAPHLCEWFARAI